MDRPENIKKEYRKRQTHAENNVKSKESNNVKSNKWKVKDNVVEEIRKTANKFSVLDSPPEDNDQEQRILIERMIEKWEEDGLKERNVENEANEMKDVLEINIGTAKVMRDDKINGVEGRVLNEDSYGL
uniref:Uncharacterized protein n=1 Tax=Tanacetum cinerariifolium TaxID=118510 RepID=A0A6L2MEN6_TANCI|nr:hypothetical protein [Tanacetum cinerariifolium]